MIFILQAARFVALSSAAALIGDALHRFLAYLSRLIRLAASGEAQANAGSCGPESLIGEATVGAGVGSDPFTLTGGKVYLTGPYKGAPFGPSISVPANAGPFNLGNIISKAKVYIYSHTPWSFRTFNPLPTIIDGIPLQIKRVNVDIDRPGFTFNLTNCNSY
jgi:hypothetical protein